MGKDPERRGLRAGQPPIRAGDQRIRALLREGDRWVLADWQGAAIEPGSAAVWRDPRRHLTDRAWGEPFAGDRARVRDEALHYLAVQRQVGAAELKQWLAGKDVLDALAVCRAVRVTGAPELFGDMVRLAVAPEIGYDAKVEDEVRYQANNLRDCALHSAVRLAIDGQRDLAPLLTLLESGRANLSMLDRLLRGAGHRRALVAGLEARLAKSTRGDLLGALGLLDARRGYPRLKAVLEASQGPDLDQQDALSHYATLWAKQLGLGWIFYPAGKIYQFAPGGLPDLERLGSEGADTAVKRAVARFEKEGPSFARLDLVEKGRWRLYDVERDRQTVLEGAPVKELARLVRRGLLRQPRREAGKLDAAAPARWQIALEGAEDEVWFLDAPAGELWVAADGTFGFGWIPDMAWGRSPALAARLETASP
jgi:hypothetical protein